MGKKEIRVLIVEDEVFIAKALSLELADFGCTVMKSVGSGELAVQSAGEADPDLIFMDINLAGSMNGIEAAREISANLDSAICFMSGYSALDIRNRLGDTKYFAILQKPVFPSQLREVLENFRAAAASLSRN